VLLLHVAYIKQVTFRPSHINNNTVTVDAIKAYRLNRGITVLIVSLRTRWIVSCPGRFTLREGNTVATEYKVAYAPEPVWTFLRSGEVFSPGGIQAPDLSVCNLVTTPTTLFLVLTIFDWPQTIFITL
jgi:hypothetical protein